MKSKREYFAKPKCIDGALPLSNGRSMLKGFAKSLLLDAAAVLSLTLCIFCVSACASLEKALSAVAAPYAIYDTQIAERESLGVEFTFANLSGKEIQSVKFFARITGGGTDFESDFSDDDAMEKEYLYCAALNAGDAERVFIPFEEFALEEDACFVESLYATEIVFSDGTLWQDSGGTQQIY